MRNLTWCALVLVLGLPLEAAETRYEADVEVKVAGMVALAVDELTARHAGIDLEVLGPDGRAVTYQLEEAISGDFPVEVKAVKEHESGWQIDLDLGAEPPRHTRLTFALVQLTSAAVELLASSDGQQFRQLAQGDLFRLGLDDTLESFALDYPATNDRFLRLEWPRSGEFPELQRVAVARLGPALEEKSLELDCHQGPSFLDCTTRLGLTASGVERLDLAWSTRQDFGIRILQARAGVWQLRSETTFVGQELVQIPVELSAPDLRLQIFSVGAVPRATALVRRPNLVWIAPGPGTYRVRFGASQPFAAGSMTFFEAQRHELALPALRDKGAWPPLPERLTAAAAGLPDISAIARHAVTSSAQPSEVVRLVLPPDLPLLTGLRIGHDGKQLPFVFRDLDVPITLERRAARPQPMPEQSGASFFRVDTAVNDVRVFLQARGPFERSVEVFQLDDRGERLPARSAFSSFPWTCAGTASLPCQIEVGSFERGAWDFVIHDGDDRPLETVEVLIERQVKALDFVWPKTPEKEVTLFHDAAWPAPTYDLEALAEILALRQPRPAALGNEIALPPVVDLPSWLLPTVICAVALALLALLARLLRQPAA